MDRPLMWGQPGYKYGAGETPPSGDPGPIRTAPSLYAPFNDLKGYDGLGPLLDGQTPASVRYDLVVNQLFSWVAYADDLEQQLAEVTANYEEAQALIATLQKALADCQATCGGGVTAG